MADYDISQAFEAIENELIDSMMRNFSRHRAEETKEGYNWSQWQAEQLKSLEEYRKKNLKALPIRKPVCCGSSVRKISKTRLIQ